MAQKIKTAMPPNLQLGGQWIVEWDAVDPTTGDSVAGVQISETSLSVAGVDGAVFDVGNPLLIGAGVSI